MASALEKMMSGKGTAAPQIEGVAVEHPQGLAQERPMTMQEKMLMGVMKQVLPGLDFAAIAKIGEDAQAFAQNVSAQLASIEAKQDKILENQAGILAYLAEKNDDGNAS